MNLWSRIKSLFNRPPMRERTIYLQGPHSIGADGRLRFANRSAWEAADGGRLHFINGDETAATPSESELTTMRERSSHLERNDALCFAAIETKVYNTITHKIRPQSLAYGDDMDKLPPRIADNAIPEKVAEAWRNQVEAAWPINAARIAADGTSFENFVALAYRTMLSRGEVLVHRVKIDPERGREFRTAYELIDCSRLSTPHELINDPDVTAGIRFDAYGAPVEYYVRKSAVGVAIVRNDFETIPAMDVRHLFRRTRPGQRRGIPDLAVIMQSAKDRKDLADATIIKAQNSAAITAVMNTANPGALESNWSTSQITEGDNTYEVMPIQKGQMQILPPADKITEFKSEYPSQTYESFQSGVKQDMARGVGLSYLSLVRDATGANFSTMKATFLQDRMTYMSDRGYIRRELLDWIWENHCYECVMGGWTTPVNYRERRSVFARVSWQFGPWGMIEPVKETEGQVLAIENNLANKATVAQAEGEDAEEIIDSNLRLEKYESDRRAEMGLPQRAEKSEAVTAEAMADGGAKDEEESDE